MNKYYKFDISKTQRANNIGILDHDIIAVDYFKIKIIPEKICIRITPPLKWKQASSFNVIAKRIPSNVLYVNSGVIIFRANILNMFLRKLNKFHALLKSSADKWLIEQSAVALAANEIGIQPMPSILNYTPWAPRPPGQISIIHYNGSSEIGIRLKNAITKKTLFAKALNVFGLRSHNIKQLYDLHSEILDKIKSMKPYFTKEC